MKVFVFEHLCSGCASGDDFSPQLVPMGSAMLTAVIADFQAMGASVSTMLDHRIQLPIKDTELLVTRVSSTSQCTATFERLCAEADLSLVIAPESDGLLEGWIAMLQARGCATLNSDLESTRLCSDKLALASALEAAGIKTPVTRILRGSSISQMTRFPVVIKPRRGAGSEWTFVCHDLSDVDAIPQWEDWIVQPRVQGVAASCAVIVHQGKATPLMAGMQIVQGDKRLHYRGGRLPLDSPAARELAARAVRAIPGLNGYVGVDMVLGDDPAGSDDVVIEINPRISMSYLGLRELCEQNLAMAMCGRTDPAKLTWRSGALRFNNQGKITWEQAN